MFPFALIIAATALETFQLYDETKSLWLGKTTEGREVTIASPTAHTQSWTMLSAWVRIDIDVMTVQMYQLRFAASRQSLPVTLTVVKKPLGDFELRLETAENQWTRTVPSTTQAGKWEQVSILFSPRNREIISCLASWTSVEHCSALFPATSIPFPPETRLISVKLFTEESRREASGELMSMRVVQGETYAEMIEEQRSRKCSEMCPDDCWGPGEASCGTFLPESLFRSSPARSTVVIDHYASFYISEAFPGSLQRYTFINTHKSTVSITITASFSSGYVPGLMLEKSTGGSMRASSTKAALVAQLSDGIFSTLSGQFTIRVEINGPKTSSLTDTVNIIIACASPVTDCYCSAGSYGISSTTSCTACPVGDILCPFAAAAGCLISSFDSYPATTFYCHPCLNPAMYLEQTSGTCQNCAGPCKSCIGPALTQCIECYTYAALSASVSECLCGNGFYPNPTAATCAACLAVCGTCVAGTTSSCTGCKANAILSAAPPSACICNAGYGGSPDNCLPCDLSCLTCSTSSSSACLSCKTNAKLFGLGPTSCICLDGLYPNLTSANCSPCDVTCLTCVGGSASQCSSCKPHAYLVLGSSPSSCACVYGYQGTPDICGLCDPTCRNCMALGVNGCSTCMYNAHLVATAPSACICNTGYFPYPTVTSCRRCYSTCATCTSYSSSACLTCYLNADLLNASPSSCVCKAGFYPYSSSTNCLACNPTCLTCRNSNMYRCYSCKTNAYLVRYSYFNSYFNSYGYCKCNTGFFPQPDASNCVGCHQSCLRCSAATQTSCTACKTNAYLSSGSCICKSGYFMDASFTCQPCGSNCLSCANTSANCVSCASGASLSSAACSCPLAGNTSCGCDTTCDTCNGAGPAYCLGCKGNTHLLSTGPSSCECNDGYYPNPTSDVCALCNGLCVTCIGPNSTDCTSCASNALLSNGDSPGSCICEDGYFNTSTTSTVCKACDATCVTCSSTACLSCFDNASVWSSACVCSVGFFPSTTSANCLPCDPTCKTCDTELNCLTCKTNASINAGSCQCSTHYYPNTTAENCSSCNINCAECVGPNIDDCTSCYPNAELEYGVSPGKCACTLTQFTTTDAAHCSACDVSCVKCSGTGPSKCTSCHINAHLNSGACVCDTGFSPLPTSASCGVCNSTCMTCSGLTSLDCLTCYPNAAKVSGECKCNTSFFPSPTVASCRACFSDCLTCSGSGEFECLTCYTGAVKDTSGKCMCDIGFFANPSAKSCTSCNSSCKHCINNTITGCTECYANAELLSGTAPDKCVCSVNFFENTTPKDCTACDVSCATCSDAGPTKCQTCYSDAKLSGTAPNSCTCLPNYFLSGITLSCTLCDSTCLACSGPLNTDCTSCTAPKSLLNGVNPGRCSCGSAMFFSSINNACSACAISCKECSADGVLSCTACFNNAEIENKATSGKCVCLKSFFPNPAENLCTPCHPTCVECQGISDVSCTSCFNLAKISSGKCVCDEDAFPAPDSSSCKMCSFLCLGCSGETPNLCTSCRAGAFLKGSAPNECVCNPGFFPSPDVSQCMQCAAGCEKCGNSGSDCVVCRSNAVLKGGICVCLEGFMGIPDASNCVKCGEGCEQCSELGCTRCRGELVEAGGQCIEKCPAGYKKSVESTCEPLDLNPPVPSLSVNSDNSLLVTFDKPMNCSIGSSDVNITAQEVDGKGIDISWSSPTPQGSDSWLIPIQFEDSFISNRTIVFLTFLYPEQLLGLNGIPAEAVTLSGTLHELGKSLSSNTSSPGVMLRTSAATTAAAASKGSVSAGVATSLINGNPASLISLVNQLQLITYLAMSKIPIPTNFASTLAALNVGEMMPNPLSGLLSFSISDSSQTPPKHVSDYGIETTLFLVNAMSFLTTSAAILASFIPIFLLSKVKVPIIAKYFAAMLPSLKWSVPLNLWLTSYLDLGVFCFLQLMNVNKSMGNALTGISLVLASIGAVAFAATPIILLIFLYRNFKLISSRVDPTFTTRWGVLFANFRQSESISSIMYYPLFVIRRFTLAITLTATADYTGILAVLNTSIAITVTTI